MINKEELNELTDNMCGSVDAINAATREINKLHSSEITFDFRAGRVVERQKTREEKEGEQDALYEDEDEYKQLGINPDKLWG